eukprot:TRINITY_DN2417_c0_g1_i7.p1 TRINITY_DN2417_c0_g1~~TRINITY_DN2417_c0_g1_i7.p1  ORF type:complete len:312 (-),score=56.06 TRINITY_DN2417_c0_g1_i7:353-1288(-)
MEGTTDVKLEEEPDEEYEGESDEEEDPTALIDIILEPEPEPEPQRQPNYFATPITMSRNTTQPTKPTHTRNTSILELDIDTLEDKPWRKPGADITDYFNYGFNEDTWREYWKRTTQMRLESQMHGKISVYDGRDLPHTRRPQTDNQNVSTVSQFRSRKTQRPREDDTIISLVGDHDLDGDGGSMGSSVVGTGGGGSSGGVMDHVADLSRHRDSGQRYHEIPGGRGGFYPRQGPVHPGLGFVSGNTGERHDDRHRTHPSGDSWAREPRYESRREEHRSSDRSSRRERSHERDARKRDTRHSERDDSRKRSRH